MKHSLKRLIAFSVISMLTAAAIFIGIISSLASDFDMRIVHAALIFSILGIAIFVISVLLISRNVTNTLESLSNTIESMIEDNPKDIFSAIEDDMLSKLQSQVIKLSGILKSHSTREKREKENITSLISDISHQLKTPLSNLNLYNSMLLEDDLSHDKRMEFTMSMQSQIEKLNWLMESLIKMSRLETGIIKLDIKRNSITETVLKQVHIISPIAEKKGFNITFHGQEGIFCSHDAKWTGEAIFNILDNGIKYGNSKLHISITTYELFCRIDIADDGYGISETEINKIFARFYRGENSKDMEGVGIGLFLARNIISIQGGYIKVKSTSRKGTVFSVFIPLE